VLPVLVTLAIALASLPRAAAAASASAAKALDAALTQDDAWYRSEAGRHFVDDIVSWQNANGGWWKSYDPSTTRPATLPAARADDAPAGDTEDVWRHTSTFDNGATYTELRVLARAHRITGEKTYADSFERGLKFIFDAQYPNGGWPQRFPLEQNYGHQITFNDNAMTNVMRLLRDVVAGQGDFAFVGAAERNRCRESFDRGVECILNCQIKVNGKLTGWCQQHDAHTLAPTKGRAYELPSNAAMESAAIVQMLMDLDAPSPRVRQAIDAAVAWFEQSKITGKRWDLVTGPQYEDGKDRQLVDDPAAPPLWARFYDLETNQPFFCGRDGVKHATVAEVPHERRVGYSWYGRWGDAVLRQYPKWQKRVGQAPSTRAAISLPANPDAVACTDSTGASFKTVQAAIDAVPADNARPIVITIAPGVHKERITIPRGKRFVTLRGDDDADPTKTVLTYDLHANSVLPGTTRPVGTSGSTSTNIQADDFTAENLTFENPSGEIAQAVAVKVIGDRAVFRRCRFLGGQDTLYADGAARQYFVDCYVEGRVDFIFGGSTAVFDRCTIHSKNGGYVTAARTPPQRPFGYVFLDCTLTGDGAPAYLGRPWQWDRGSNAAVAFIRCKMGPHIRAAGWDPWDRTRNTNPAANTRYVEFASTDLDGKPLDVSQRVPWSHQLSADEAAKYTVDNILGGEDHWHPPGPSN
jgi:pectinesterase